MDKITRENLVPMSREELKFRGFKNIRRKNGFKQLHYVDGLGNDVVLIGDENNSESFGNMAEKYPKYMKSNLSISDINKTKMFLKIFDETFEDDFPCPICHGENGHRINCPEGIAFSNIK